MHYRTSTFNRFPAVTNVKNDFNGADAEENEIRELSNCGKLLFYKLIFYSVFHSNFKSNIAVGIILCYLTD